MNPRTFCREAGFPRCIALSYSFHPLFFERIILRDLWYGGSGDITILGDQGELQESVSRYEGQFNYLGTRYLLTPADTVGVFHPKILVRIGPQGARILMGSGNLTFGGWGGNKELGVELVLDADQPTSAITTNSILASIEPYISSDAAREAMARFKDYPWLASEHQEFEQSLFITKPEEPLSQILEERWSGRRFDKMVVFTGSTDEKGAFPAWCSEQFGVEECVVAVTPDNASFLKKEIDNHSVNIVLAPFTGSQMLHAKFYWFDGPDGPAAVVGSANCSRAAWLMSPMEGGNVECINIYDHPKEEDFEEILALLPENRISVEKTSPAEKEDEEDGGQEIYRIQSIVLVRSREFVEVTLEKMLPPGSSVFLHGPDRITLPLNAQSPQIWWGNIDESILWPDGATLAKVEIEIDGQRFKSPIHWIDDMDAINKASQAKQIVGSFGGLAHSKTNSEHDKVVSDFAMISSSIFTESAAYNDPTIRRGREDSPDGDKRPSAPVKPEDLIKSLEELDIKEPRSPSMFGSGIHLSLFGVMRALYEEFDSLHPDNEVEDEAEVEEDPEDQLDVDPPKKPPKKPPGPPRREPPPERYRQRLREDLEKFFERLSSKEFSAECTATKMVQATAYPLAVALVGERGRWLEPHESRTMVTRVVDILLNRRRNSKTEAIGLLEEVGNRYEEKHRYDVFLQVVGDGTLWVAMLTALAQLSWSENFEKFERAISMDRVYHCTELRSDTSVGKLGALVNRVQVESARELIVSEAPICAGVMETIESILGTNYKDLLKYQNTMDHQIDDIIWNPSAGWGRVVGKPANNEMLAYLHRWGEARNVLSKNFYLNLRNSAEKFPLIRAALNKIDVVV